MTAGEWRVENEREGVLFRKWLQGFVFVCVYVWSRMCLQISGFIQWKCALQGFPVRADPVEVTQCE